MSRDRTARTVNVDKLKEREEKRFQMTIDEVIAKIQSLDRESITFSDYTQIKNDAFRIVFEMAKMIKALQEEKGSLEPRPPAGDNYFGA